MLICWVSIRESMVHWGIGCLWWPPIEPLYVGGAARFLSLGLLFTVPMVSHTSVCLRHILYCGFSAHLKYYLC